MNNWLIEAVVMFMGVLYFLIYQIEAVIERKKEETYTGFRKLFDFGLIVIWMGLLLFSVFIIVQGVL